MTLAWLRAFALTIAVEVPLVTWLMGGQSRLAWPNRACIIFAAQLMTHPLVWFVFPTIPGMSRMATLILSELWAWLAEAAFYALVDVAPTKLGAVGISALANGASLGLGFLLL
jgi:hypothetical protein